MTETLRTCVQDTRKALEAPIQDLDALTEILSPPLHFLGLSTTALPAQQQSEWTSLDPSLRPAFIAKHLPHLQSVLLRVVYVDWKEQLEQSGCLHSLFEPYLCPPTTTQHETAPLVALSAVSVILSLFQDTTQTHLHPLSVNYAVQQLSTVLSTHPLDRIYQSISTAAPTNQLVELEWTQATKLLFSIPGRVSNAQQRYGNLVLPKHLESSAVLSSLARSFVHLLSLDMCQPEHASLVLSKFIHTGYLRSSSDNFWSVTLPSLWPALYASSSTAKAWAAAVDQLPKRDVQRLQASLVSHLCAADYSLKPLLQRPYQPSEAVSMAAHLCLALFGPWTGSEVFLDRRGWNVVVARVVVAWARLSDRTEDLVWQSAAVWSDPVHVERAPEQERECLTFILLLAVHNLPPHSPPLKEFSSSEHFLSGVQAHLSTSRAVVRFLGMLTAELVSQRTLDPQSGVKPLDFGADVWEANKLGLEACREIRAFVQQKQEDAGETGRKAPDFSHVAARDLQPVKVPSTPKPAPSVKPAEPAKPPKASTSKITILSSSTAPGDGSDDDDDDDLQPYAMPEDELEAEPLPENEDLSAHTPAKNKPKPPVYIPDLTRYLKSAEEPDWIEMGLKYADTLIRKRANWGIELQEHATDLAFALIGLNNNFELEQFDEMRQKALTALVASAPKQAAPAMIEQYFTPHYSVDQRFVMLTSLAFGARELAGLSQPLPSTVSSFPSKELPPALHAKLVEFEAGPFTKGGVDGLASQVASSALGDIRDDASRAHGPTEEERRESMLSTRAPPRSRVSSKLSKPAKQTQSESRYGGLAEGCFVMPLVNRMWLSLHHGAGSADSLLLPLLLSRFFSTLSLLVHAASHAFSLQRIIPEVLGLTLALKGASDEEEVVAAQMELVVVSLQTASLDTGTTEKMLMRESDTRGMVFACRDWAEAVWTAVEGQAEVGRLGRNAAGVLLRVEQMSAMC